MAKLNHSYEPHLTVRQLTLPPGGEWAPHFPAWIILQITSGNGYWLHPETCRALETGTVIAATPQVVGSIRASQMGELTLHFFRVCPERLIEMLTLGEQRYFETAALRRDALPPILPPSSPIAAELRELNAGPGGALQRLQLLHLFLRVFEPKPEPERSGESNSDARERLWTFLKQTPTAELLHLNFADLVQITRCTPRHFGRIFRGVVGMSFREKQAELRLLRACKLLATTESKVVDIALESGYQSLSLFNLMFTRRFGMSPGRWRQKSGKAPAKLSSRRPILSPARNRRALVAGLETKGW